MSIITRALIERITLQNRGWRIDLETGAPLTRNFGEMIALVHAELSEAYLGYVAGYMDDHLPQYKMYDVELVDAIIRVCDIAGGLGLDVVKYCGGTWKHAQYGLLDSALLDAHLTLSHALKVDLKQTGDAAFFLGCFLAQCEALLRRNGAPTADILDAKLAYNAKRADHTLESRRAAGGKKY